MSQQNISKHKYQNREVFLSDVSLIHTNSIKYNGKHVSIVVIVAVIMIRKCRQSKSPGNFSQAQTVHTQRPLWI